MASTSADESRAHTPSSVDKPRNKLGYQRITIACGFCRKRKIRCVPSEKDPQGRCDNCIRLKKECVFQPVEISPSQERSPQHRPARSSKQSSAIPPNLSIIGPQTQEGTGHDIQRFTVPSNGPPDQRIVSEPSSAISAASAGSLNSAGLGYQTYYNPDVAPPPDWTSRSYCNPQQYREAHSHVPTPWTYAEPSHAEAGAFSQPMHGAITSTTDHAYPSSREAQSFSQPVRSASWTNANMRPPPEVYQPHFNATLPNATSDVPPSMPNLVAHRQESIHSQTASPLPYQQTRPEYPVAYGPQQEQWAAPPQYAPYPRHDSAYTPWAMAQMQNVEHNYYYAHPPAPGDIDPKKRGKK